MAEKITPNRVWIELEGGTAEQMQERARKANRVLGRLREAGVSGSEFTVYKGKYPFGDCSGTEELVDNGHPPQAVKYLVLEKGDVDAAAASYGVD